MFWRDFCLRWKRYEPMVSVATVEDFLNIVDADENRCFLD
jgi:hypothetical protein